MSLNADGMWTPGLGSPAQSAESSANIPTGTGFRRVTSGVEDAAAVTETGTGGVVRAISPVLSTPNIGVATATSVNGSVVPSSDTLVGRATADTLTNKRITVRVVQLTDATPIAVNCDITDLGKLLTLSQASQIGNPSGAPVDGQILALRIKSSSIRVLTYDTQYKGSVDQALIGITSGSSLTDYFEFRWNADNSKWELIRKVLGL